MAAKKNVSLTDDEKRVVKALLAFFFTPGRKPGELDALVFLAGTMVAGLGVLLPFWIWELASGVRIPFDAGSIGAVVYIGVFASLFAFILWNRCVAVLGPSVTGASFHLVALFTAILAFLVLGEPVAGFHIIGAALILCGFFVATGRWPARRIA